jgi:putative CocE/NonD family hydrolase
MIPMSDRVHLAADVWLPDGPGPFPTLLVRTPYHRRQMPPLYVDHGYALVVQDCRGKYESEGLFTPLADEARDGQDTIAWIADQKWCNGRIGMLGGSYLGFVQVPAAAGGHEALRCIVPQVASASFFRHWARYDGCPSLCNAIGWLLGNVSRTTTQPWRFELSELYSASTLDELFGIAGFECEPLRSFFEHDRYDDYWASIDQFPMHEQIRIPAYHMGSWFDHHLQGQCETFGRIRDLGATESARKGQRMLVGPWGHAAYRTVIGSDGVQDRRYGDWEFPEEACVSVRTFEKRFLDFHMKDRDDGFGEEPPVRVFLMGANRWIDLPDWPPPDADVQGWYLRSNGHADPRNGPGRLTRESPGQEPPDRYTYDPMDPMPTRGGPVFQGIEARGPQDQRPLFDRSDFVYYQSDPLPEPMALIGNIELELWVASSALDTDFIARLCVVEPSGAVTCFTYGSLRCKYRESWSDPTPLEPDTPTPIHIQMGHTACVLPQGSRIAILITSSCYPRIVPNSNTMAGPFSGAEPVPANHEILHDANRPSCLHLPVVEV